MCNTTATRTPTPLSHSPTHRPSVRDGGGGARGQASSAATFKTAARATTATRPSLSTTHTSRAVGEEEGRRGLKDQVGNRCRAKSEPNPPLRIPHTSCGGGDGGANARTTRATAGVPARRRTSEHVREATTTWPLLRSGGGVNRRGCDIRSRGGGWDESVSFPCGWACEFLQTAKCVIPLRVGTPPSAPSARVALPSLAGAQRGEVVLLSSTTWPSSFDPNSRLLLNWRGGLAVCSPVGNNWYHMSGGGWVRTCRVWSYTHNTRDLFSSPMSRFMHARAWTMRWDRTRERGGLEQGWHGVPPMLGKRRQSMRLSSGNEMRRRAGAARNREISRAFPYASTPRGRANQLPPKRRRGQLAITG
jgi:hypothetical protein